MLLLTMSLKRGPADLIDNVAPQIVKKEKINPPLPPLKFWFSEVPLWVPLWFRLTRDPNLELPQVAIPYGERKIDLSASYEAMDLSD